MDIDRLEAVQMAMAKQVEIWSDEAAVRWEPEAVIFSVDIQYVGERAYVAVDIRRYDHQWLGVYGGESAAGMAYMPRFFCFREGPPLQSVLERVIAATGYQPTVIIVDGHGVAHPLRLGVASWLGVQMGVATVGMAKDTLLQYEGVLGTTVGSTLAVKLEGMTVGQVLRTQDQTNPIYVSAGHRMNLAGAVGLATHLRGKYRIPEPLRVADHWARVWAKEGGKGAMWDEGHGLWRSTRLV